MLFAQEEIEWGKTASSGLQCAATLKGDFRWAQAFSLDIRLRNTSSDATMTLDSGQLWVLVAENRSTAYFTVPVAIEPIGLKPGKEHRFTVLEIAPNCYPYNARVRIQNGYPHPVDDGELREAGPITTIVPYGRPITMSVFLSFGKEEVHSVKSSNLVVEVMPPDLKKLPDELRRTLVAGIVKGFQGNAYTAQAASAKAVPLGEQILPVLLPLLDDKKTPNHGVIWLIATFCNIGGDAATQAVLKVLSRQRVWEGMGYHCVKLKSDAIDKKLVERAMEPGNEELGVWAIRGFIENRDKAPAALIEHALKSDSAKLRNYAIIAIGHKPDAAAVKRLTDFVTSDDESTRASAAQALVRAGQSSDEVLTALVTGLAKPSQYAQPKINDALNKLTGNKASFAFDPKNPQAAVDYWQKWLKEQKK